MTGKYDLIFSVGDACSCSQCLRAADLQFASFPWDWIAFPELPERAELMCNGYRGWLELEDLELVQRGPSGGSDHYLNRRNGVIFNHDFPAGVPAAESFAAVKEKYDRRIARLDRLIDAAERPVLAVRLETPAKAGHPTPLDDCRLFRRRLAERHPGKKVEFCLVSLDRGRQFADRIEEEPEDGFLHVAFDYADHTPGVPDYTVDFKTLVPFLRARFSVKDYRTAEERRAWREMRRRKKYEKAGVSGFWGLVRKRIFGAFGKGGKK